MSPIPQMEGRDHRIHAGFGRHLAGARAFHFKSLSIGVIAVICGFNSLFQDQEPMGRWEPAESSIGPVHKKSARNFRPGRLLLGSAVTTD